MDPSTFHHSVGGPDEPYDLCATGKGDPMNSTTSTPHGGEPNEPQHLFTTGGPNEPYFYTTGEKKTNEVNHFHSILGGD